MPRLLASLVLLWWNAYLIRQAFGIAFTGQMHSMHGYWESLGRLASEQGWVGSWIDAFGGGVPVEWAYAPLVPLLSHWLGSPSANAIAFCAGPPALFFLAWRLSGRVIPSFLAGGLYTVLSPTEWILPDGEFGWRHLLDARRMYLTFGWDETPHELGLACACVVMGAWLGGQWRLAVAACAIGALASPFAITGCALLGVCWLLTGGWRHWRIVATTAGCAYLIVLPWYSPSLLLTIRRNGALTPESGWTSTSWLAVLVTAGGLFLLCRATRALARDVRFALVFVCWMISIPFLFYKFDLRYLEQAGRYKSEMELAIALAVAIGLGALPSRAWWVTLAAIVPLLTVQTIEHRRFSKRFLAPADPTATIEYQVAKWLEVHQAGRTVYAPGSFAPWLNRFGNVRQFSGGAYTTMPNPAQQQLLRDIEAARDWRLGLELLRRARVDAIVVPGPESPEFWNPFEGRDIYAGHLPELWRERDTAIYAVPDSGGPPFTEPFHGHWEFRLCRWLSVAGLILFARPPWDRFAKRRGPGVSPP